MSRFVAKNLNAKPKPRMDPNPVAEAVELIGQVYIACCAGSTLYKIGFTRQGIDKLRQDLQRGNPDPLFIIATFCSFDPTGDESEIHTRYADKRHPVCGNREWFALTGQDLRNLLIEFRERNQTFKETLAKRLASH
jgi:Meiotically up-regulated gene 113